jgi:nucleoside-diphosphate-sugar epimerase
MTNVLFIGGTGIISSACSPLAIEKGLDLTLFNRGTASAVRPVPERARVVQGDINNPAEVEALLAGQSFDVVVNWIAFSPEQIERDIRVFNGRVGQYVFISSASAYQKPVPHLPITEETPLGNPFWAYSRNKQACEERLLEVHREQGFPVTIVRPSHTYDKTLLPFTGGFTSLGRMLAGKPVIIHGDGTSLWVLTHHRDFARGFVGLLGRPEAIGQVYHITSDELLTWNQIYTTVAEAAGATLRPVYVPSTEIARYDEQWGAGLLGDSAHSVIFDNSKIKALVPEFRAEVPFRQGCRETVDWYLSDPARQRIDPALDALMDQMAADRRREP